MIAELALVVAGVVAARCQDAPLRVATSLEGAAFEALRAHLQRAAPGRTDLSVLPPARLADLVARGETPPADLLFGVDVEHAAALARSDRLAVFPALGAAIEPFHVDGARRFVCTLAELWVFAAGTSQPAASELPDRVDDLLDERWTGRFVLPDPNAAAALWVQWFQVQLAQGHTTERALAWCGTLDARAIGYREDIRGVVAELERGGVELALVPFDFVRENVALVHSVHVAPSPIRGLAQAIVRNPAAAPVEPVWNALLAPELARDLAACGLLPCERRGTVVAWPAWLESAARSARRVQPEPEFGPSWLAAWRQRVEGRGRNAESVDAILDIVFGALFVLFLVVVYTRLRATEG